MSGDTGQERLNMKMLALFLIGGSLGAILTSCIFRERFKSEESRRTAGPSFG